MKPSLFAVPAAVLLSLTLLLPLETDAAEQPDPAFGHSLHGEVFNEGPRQEAVMIPGTGQVDFKVTTKSEEAQAFFNQGIGQLHGFWDFEAERSFRQVAAIDPDCAMAYWGMAMANFKNSKRAKGFMDAATERKASASEREQMWIDSLADYFKDEKADEKKRLRELVRRFEDLVLAYPDDIEAKAFLMKQIYYNNGKGHPINSHLTANLLIDEILEVNSQHPSHHYRIHLWDKEKPERALQSAAQCGPAAPAIAHMWHMPGHIYSRLHRYQDAVWQQEASARIDHAHMTRYQVVPDQIHNFAHNNEWLIRNLNFIGRSQDAIDLACNMIELPRLPKFKSGTEDYYHTGGSWTYGRIRLRDTLINYEQWDQLLAFGEDQHYLAADIDAIDETEWNRIMGIAAFESDKAEQGAQFLTALETGAANLKKEQEDAIKKAEKKATSEEKSEADIKKAKEAAKKEFATKITDNQKAINELTAYQKIFASTDPEAAKEALEKVETMGKSRKTRLLLRLGETEAALKLATEDANGSPGQVIPLATKIQAEWSAGKKDEALKSMQKLRTLAAAADLGVPVFQRLAPILEAAELEGDWRTPAQPATDLGERPELAKLGPFRWQPPLAKEFKLPTAKDEPVSLSSYRGRPVVVIFYLGKGCSHCMEQLNEFAPLQQEFTDAGIDILAISTDSTEGLRETYRDRNGEEETNPFPFPLLSDPELKTFKDYRAYDDFEEMALHGTFLIDEVGQVRWQNISYEPFMHPKFLLEECVRLLSLGDS